MKIGVFREEERRGGKWAFWSWLGDHNPVQFMLMMLQKYNKIFETFNQFRIHHPTN
jgi:hypothetical protein